MAMSEPQSILEPAYNYRVVRQFTLMTLVWGVLGMSLGVFIAAQLVWPELNFGLPWTSFGRLRRRATGTLASPIEKSRTCNS